MNKTNIAITVVALVALVVAVVSFGKPRTSTTVVESPNYGAVSSPDVQSDYLCVGGVCQTYRRSELKSATTTLCALPSPAATSTLDFASVRIASTGTTSALTLSIAKSATAFATTTLLSGDQAVAANGPHTSFASTTVPLAIFSPNTWLVVSIAGGTGGQALTVPSGSCDAVFNMTN